MDDGSEHQGCEHNIAAIAFLICYFQIFHMWGKDAWNSRVLMHLPVFAIIRTAIEKLLFLFVTIANNSGKYTH